ncbi:uncharacterized protein [Nicotiana tomentosiformis]|uniref:uncharacterized protein n=1 Tax=Nicotiana tomentosiformis TaxID=4098 RepID=UPI00051BE8B4|nr:craniofacial development protein 2-like [Nicotiana tomentosiformis]
MKTLNTVWILEHWDVGSWNNGTLTGKSIELVKILQKRKINIACVQETRWKGTRARDVDGFKIWYSRSAGGKNRVGILVDRDLRELVVEVSRVNDRLMSIKHVVGGITVKVISAYAPQSFPKREEHLVTFRNLMGKTHIDYLLDSKCDKGLCTDCKVIPSEYFTALHRLLVMDLEINRSRKKRTTYMQPKIK